MNKHVLFIPAWYLSYYKPHAGSFFQEQAISLSDAGYKMGIISVNNYPVKLALKFKKFVWGIEKWLDKGIQTYRYNCPRLPIFKRINSLLVLQAYKSLFRRYIQKNGKPDIIHIHSYKSGIIGLWIKKKWGIPYVVTEHSSSIAKKNLHPYFQKQAKSLYNNSAERIAVSKSLRTFLEEKFSMNFKYIPNFIKVNKFQISKDKNSGFTFLNIGWFKKNKNHIMLIDSFHKAFPNNENIKLQIIGEGIERSNIEKRIKELNLNNRIKLTGALDREVVAREMQKANAFVLSSNYETFGVVLIEAMSCGLPLISTRCGGPETIIDQDFLGRLCDNNTDSLAATLNEVLKNDYDSEKIREYAIQNYSEESVIVRISQIYETVLEGVKNELSK